MLVKRKDEDFVMQSSIDKMSKQYVVEVYGSEIATLISLFAGRKIRLYKKMENDKVRIYRIKNSFDLLHEDCPFFQNFSIHDLLKFDTETGHISKYL